MYKKQSLTESQVNRHKRHTNRVAIKGAIKRTKSNMEENPPAEEHCLSDNEAVIIENIGPIFKDASTQTDLCLIQNDSISKTVEVTELPKPKMVDKEVSAFENAKPGQFLCCHGFHGYSSLANEGKAMLDLAGVAVATFTFLLSFVPDCKERKISKENRLLIFLMKMKLGLSYSALRVLFGIHRTTVSTIFKTTLGHLTDRTKNLIFWPSLNSIKETMPTEFREKYPNCRVIIDCTEIKVEQPNTVDARNFLYSNYKSAYTMKFLIGITPSGMISFISKCYGGRSSDSAITVDCGLLNLLEPGDEVMADKGFPGIKSSLEDKHVLIVMPPFLHNGRFTSEEVDETYKVASVRIHVERMIQRVKVHNILQKVTNDLYPHIDDIVHMCCVLANLQPPII